MQNKANSEEKDFKLLSIFPPFRRLNTLNKCASMKLDVNLPKKKVSDAIFLLNLLGMCIFLVIECYSGFDTRIRMVIIPIKKLYSD